MKISVRLVALLLTVIPLSLSAQTYNQIDEFGNVTTNDESNPNFNPHNNDSSKSSKVIPKGLKVWTIDRKFGDIIKAEPDTLPHLYPNTTLSMGKYGQYNTIGSNYLARQNRIFIDRPASSQFYFTEVYDQAIRQPDQLHFTNTLSPITNLSYDNCGDKTDGEDHLEAKFAVNAGKRVGLGFDLNYAYARGYFSNQAASHFGATIYGSYIGDQYNLHAMFSTYHQKATENGGITDDKYIVHPEAIDQSFSDNEIPTVLSSNWNRNDNLHLFLSHRYNIGFYRKVPMTEEEIKARKFAMESEKEKEQAKQKDKKEPTFAGRPKDAAIVGAEPPRDSTAIDTTRIKVDSQEMLDSLLLAEKRKQAEEDSTMKQVFVPVTSIIHTLEMNKYDRIYQAYGSPND